MGKVVVDKRKKKKKGRPSLLHLQKRTILKQPNPNPNSKITPTSHLRSTRRNPNSGDNSVATDDENDDGSGSGSGSGHRRDTEKAEKHVTTPNCANTSQGTQLDMGPSTPLPEKNLLLFILDRLQKKDTHGVFAKPVDPEELPDYHEVVEHPMDFGTVRKNLAGGAYVSLEHFEKDVFLICSNAMQYNSPETIYFRQARYIQEMAKKYFKDLRQESDDNEPERKIVRRGRPPTKNLKKQIGRPPLERAGSQFSLDAMLATGADNNEPYSGRLADKKSQRSAEITDSIQQGSWMKRGKKHFVVDESRRNTYKQTHISSGPREPSVITTFDGQRRQLMAVGLHTDYGYARSLARFGANLGAVAWKVVSERIENSLPAGVEFGPGWVGDIEELQLKSSSIPSNSSTQPNPPSSSLSKPLSRPEISCATPTSMEIESEKSPDISEGNKLAASTHSTAINGQPNKACLSSAPTSSPISGNIFPVRGSANPLRELNSHTNTSTMNSAVNMIRPRPAVQIHHPSMYGFTSPRAGLHLQPHLKHVFVQKNKDTVPPDLNIRFQSPGSPTLSRSDSAQPDLVLQL